MLAVLLLGAVAVAMLSVPAAAQDGSGNETPAVDQATPAGILPVTGQETPAPDTGARGEPGALAHPASVQGDVAAAAASLDIAVDPASVTLGDAGGMAIPGSYQASVTITISASGIRDWNLGAEDTTPGNPRKGFMFSSSPVRNLATPFRIWDYTRSPPDFRDLGTGPNTWYRGSKPGKSTVTALFRQDTTRTDLAGTYSLVVTFTATTP